MPSTKVLLRESSAERPSDNIKDVAVCAFAFASHRPKAAVTLAADDIVQNQLDRVPCVELGLIAPDSDRCGSTVPSSTNTLGSSIELLRELHLSTRTAATSSEESDLSVSGMVRSAAYGSRINTFHNLFLAICFVAYVTGGRK